MPGLGSFNQFRGAAGNDRIIGNGNTRLDFGSAITGITFDFGRKKVGDGQGGIDTFSGVNSPCRDRVRGSSCGVRRPTRSFIGQGGDDLIEGVPERRGTLRRGHESDNERHHRGHGRGNGSGGPRCIWGLILSPASRASAAACSTTSMSRQDLRAAIRSAPSATACRSTRTTIGSPGMSGNDMITGNGQTNLDYRGASAAVTVTFTGQGKGTDDRAQRKARTRSPVCIRSTTRHSTTS